MFCRRCYYDLRGQRTPRCPECGAAFAFEDPTSYLGERPRRVARMLLWLRRRRVFFLGILTVLLVLYYVFAYSKLTPPYRSVHPGVRANVNLKAILLTWRLQQNDDPQQTVFDVESAKQDMRPGLSPWCEARAARWGDILAWLLGVSPWFAAPTISYLLVAAVFVGRRARRGAAFLVAALCFLLLCSAYSHRIVEWSCPGSYAFLNDYAYVVGVDFTASRSRRGQTIAAYAIRTLRTPGPRFIGYADGHVVTLWDERAMPLFEAQGIPYPEPNE